MGLFSPLTSQVQTEGGCEREFSLECTSLGVDGLFKTQSGMDLESVGKNWLGYTFIIKAKKMSHRKCCDVGTLLLY